MTKKRNSYRNAIDLLGVGESVTFARAAKASVLRATACSVGRDTGKAFTVSAPAGKSITVTRIK